MCDSVPAKDRGGGGGILIPKIFVDERDSNHPAIMIAFFKHNNQVTSERNWKDVSAPV